MSTLLPSTFIKIKLPSSPHPPPNPVTICKHKVNQQLVHFPVSKAVLWILSSLAEINSSSLQQMKFLVTPLQVTIIDTSWCIHPSLDILLHMPQLITRESLLEPSRSIFGIASLSCCWKSLRFGMGNTLGYFADVWGLASQSHNLEQ